MGKCMVQPAGAAAEVISTLREVRQGGASFAETGASHHGSLNSSSSPTRLAHLVEFTSCEALEPNNPELATLVAFFRGAVGARSLGHGLRFQHEVGGCYPWIRRPAGDAEELCSVGLGASWSRTCSSKGGRAIGKRGTGHHRRREAGGCADTLLLTAFLVKLWSAFASPMPKGSW